jgi:hypothetical protein
VSPRALAAIDGGLTIDVASGEGSRCSRHAAAAGGAVAPRIATATRPGRMRTLGTTCGARIRCAAGRRPPRLA